MRTTLLTYEVPPSLSCYPDFNTKVDVTANAVKAFLPFLKSYSFQDAFQALSEMLQFELNEDGASRLRKEKNSLYEVHRLAYLFLNMDAVLQNQKTKDVWIYDQAKEMFENIQGNNQNALQVAKYIDLGLLFDVDNFYGLWNKNVKILMELRKAFLRLHALDNELDLSLYLD